MRKIIVLVAALAALAACGKRQSDSASSGAAPAVAVASGGAAAAPADMPAWAGPMTGARLETAMGMGAGRGILAYHTDAKPDAVLADYDARVASAGLKKITQSPGDGQGGTGAIWSSDPPGGDTSKRLSVTAGPEGGRTRVDITYKAGG